MTFFGYSLRLLISSMMIFLLNDTANAAASILQRGYNQEVTGANLSETILTTANVSSATFGRLFSLPVDGNIYAQPLYVPNLHINGATHNVLYVATMNDSIYAFDADKPGAPLWAMNYANAIPGSTPVPITAYVGTNADNIAGNVGIESTPVIYGSYMYFVTNTIENGQIVFSLHAINIYNGAEKLGSPVVINGSTTTNGVTVNFTANVQNQRASLVVAKGDIIVCFTGHEDMNQYYGWVMAYNYVSLKQTGIFNPAATVGNGAGIWQSGRPPVVDSSGYVYLFTANNFVSPPLISSDGVHNFAESALKLDPGQGLKVVDYFTPANYQTLESQDWDMSSAGPSLIPGTNVLVGGGKFANLYLLNTHNLGKMQANDAGALQRLSLGNSNNSNEFHGGPVVWNRSATAGGPLIFNWPAYDYLSAFAYNASARSLGKEAVQQNNNIFGYYPGGYLALSANGNTQGILWAVLNSSTINASSGQGSGELHAFNAANLNQELWNSTLLPSRDDLGLWAKNVPPVVVNGKVYAASQSKQVVVYGLLPDSGAALVTAWPPVQSALGGSAVYAVNALNSAGDDITPAWSVSGLPTGASESFQSDGHGGSVLNVTLGATTPRGSYRLSVTATVNSVATQQTVLLNVTDASFSSVSIQTATAQTTQVGNPVGNVIDNNASTYWMSQPGYPESVVLDLGSAQAITGISYLPPQNGCVNGAGEFYLISLSQDGINWQTESAGGSFDYGPGTRNFACDGNSYPMIQYVSFPVTNARYLQVNFINSITENTVSLIGAATINIYTANGSVPFSGNYLLTVPGSNLVLDGLSNANDSLVTQRKFAKTTDQQWQISKGASAGYYKLTDLKSLANPLVLDVASESTVEGALLNEALLNLGIPTASQQFSFTSTGDGSGHYTITNLNSGLCADVSPGASVGETIQQWPCSATPGTPLGSQSWAVTPASPAIP